MLDKIEDYLNESLLRDDRLIWEQTKKEGQDKGFSELDDLIQDIGGSEEEDLIDVKSAEEETKEYQSMKTGLKS